MFWIFVRIYLYKSISKQQKHRRKQELLGMFYPACGFTRKKVTGTPDITELSDIFCWNVERTRRDATA